MKEKVLNLNYKKAFITVAVLLVALALVSVIAVPLSLSQQIREAWALEKAAHTDAVQQSELRGEGDGEHDRECGRGDWEDQLTPLGTGHFVLFGTLGLLLFVLGAVYWLLVVAWLYQNALGEGMNRSLWPILGLFFNLFAVFAFLIVRDRPARVKEAA